MPSTRKKKDSVQSTANLGFEAKLWAAADALRNNMDTDIVDCIVALPGQLFTDARKLGTMPDRGYCGTLDADIAKLDVAVAPNLKELGYGQ